MKAMLDARMVPARIHLFDSAAHGSAVLADRMIVSSHGVLIEDMDATQRTFGQLRPFSNGRESCLSRILRAWMSTSIILRFRPKSTVGSRKPDAAPDELIEDAVAWYFEELTQTREMLNSRYDDLKSGKVKPISDAEVIVTSARRA